MSRTLRTSMPIEASARHVWDVLTDLEAYGGWNSYYLSAQGELVVGRRLQMTVAWNPAGKPAQSRPTVVEVQPLESISWRNRLILPGILTATHRFHLTPTSETSVLFEQSETFGGIASPFVGKALAEVHARLRHFDQALKEHAESSARR